MLFSRGPLRNWAEQIGEILDENPAEDPGRPYLEEDSLEDTAVLTTLLIYHGVQHSPGTTENTLDRDFYIFFKLFIL